MKTRNRFFTLLIAVLISLSAISSAMAAEQIKKSEEIPALEVIKEGDGIYSVTAKDQAGKVAFYETGLTGNVEDIIENVYNNMFRNAAKACSHIPCNHKIVTGGINHIINTSTGICTMVTTDFYQCACCNEILGMVPNSTKIVGTHAAH